MTDLIAELKALKEKATPGPWYHRQAGEVSKRVQFPLGGYSKAGEPYDWIADDPRLGCHKKIIVGRGAFYGGTADYALVCALVNHLPTILAKLEEGERMREALLMGAKALRDEIAEGGDCDHSVGICWCDTRRKADALEFAAGAHP